jgi:D-3-phosphoglycerate dehydrogenase
MHGKKSKNHLEECSVSNVLITSKMFGRYSPEPMECLVKAGLTILPNPFEGRVLSEEELVQLIGDADAVILGNERITERVLDAAPKLKVIARFGVGYDRVDVDAARRRGIAVTITPGANVEAVAELALGLMIALLRKITEADQKTRMGEFPNILGVELSGRQLGIVGFGRIGQAVAKRALAFDMKVVAFDITDRSYEAESLNTNLLSLDELMATSDVISLHLPGGVNTNRLIGRRAFSIMKRGSYLINTSRASVVDTEALVEALKSGQLSGAAVDVFDVEPPPADHPLFALSNVIVTPHMGGSTDKATDKMGMMAVQNVISVLKSGLPLNPV